MDKPRDPKADLALCAALQAAGWRAEVREAPNEHFSYWMAAPCGDPILTRDGLAAVPAIMRHWIERARAAEEQNARPIVGGTALERLCQVLAEFERKTEAVPLGEEDAAKGASVYNWRRAFIKELKAAISGQREEAQGDALA